MMFFTNFSSCFSSIDILFNLNFPVVSVPVLSKTTVSIFANASNVFPPFISNPFFVAKPTPTITAVGVAKPIAQGQEITKTAMLLKKDSIKLWVIK